MPYGSGGAWRAKSVSAGGLVSHAAMLEASRRLGRAGGWRTRSRRAVHGTQLESYLNFLPEDVRQRARAILNDGCRIPEEVLGPEDLEALWSGSNGDV